MEPRVSLITLGVADLARAVAFYESVLGWKVAAHPPGVAFFDLGGLVFALYPHADLAHDMGLAEPARGGGYEGFALAHNLRSEHEVDALFAHLQRQGATIVKPPQKAQWGGYSGYFADPDGHRWEVAHNPFWTVGADGRIALSPP
ncbi:MAG: VOC family protein [Ideonella sp.]|nr:VOC family protein [Ideonella sp.]MCC7455468.1 VOC family protein [Nitrospira sp.]